MAIHDISNEKTTLQPYTGHLITQAVREVYEKIQAPEEMVMSTLLVAMSTAAHGFADIQWPDGRISPLSLFFLIRARSGERKSALFSHVFSSIINFQREVNKEFECLHKAYLKDLEVYQKTRSEIIRKLATKVSKGEDVTTLERALEENEERVPKPVKKFSIIYDDATPEALVHGMSENTRYASLVSSEGGSILNSGAFRDFSKINEIWSGGSIQLDRKSAGSIYVEDPRLSVLIMVQPDVHDIYMRRVGKQSRSSGMLARFLVLEPNSMIGKRTPSVSATPDRYFLQLSNIIRRFLIKTVDVTEGRRKRELIKLSPQAVSRFFEISNNIEINSAPGGIYQGFEDHASKLPENILRVAAVLQIFDNGMSREITVEALEHAMSVVLLHSEHFRKIFYAPTEEEIDDQQLWSWLQTEIGLGYRYLAKNYVRRHTKPRLRRVERLDASLSRLAQRGIINMMVVAGIQCIDLYPGQHFDYNIAYHAVKPVRRRQQRMY